MTLSPGGRNLLLVLHVIASVALLGADGVLVVLSMSELGGADPASVYPPAHLVGTTLVAPLAVASLITGVALARLSHWGLFRYWWVTIKLVITAVLTALVLFVLVPALGRLADESESGTPERAPLFVAAPLVASSLLILNVVLAVYKPRWRLGARDPQQVG